ncbi:MAG: hypothetical protein FJX46_00145 [Alphaproteobacteria bacterium]|nr:hypothetical protein [Alphaproteobacteria bacterium]
MKAGLIVLLIALLAVPAWAQKGGYQPKGKGVFSANGQEFRVVAPGDFCVTEGDVYAKAARRVQSYATGMVVHSVLVDCKQLKAFVDNGVQFYAFGLIATPKEDAGKPYEDARRDYTRWFAEKYRITDDIRVQLPKPEDRIQQVAEDVKVNQTRRGGIIRQNHDGVYFATLWGRNEDKRIVKYIGITGATMAKRTILHYMLVTDYKNAKTIRNLEKQVVDGVDQLLTLNANPLGG